VVFVLRGETLRVKRTTLEEASRLRRDQFGFDDEA
jgi:hypothetical protein